MTDPPPVLAYTQLTGPILDAPAMQCGKYLVTPFEATLPIRCVLCNGQADLPLIHLRIPTGESFRFQVFPKFAHLHVGFCRRHKRIANIARCFTVALILLALVCILACFGVDEGYSPHGWITFLPTAAVGSFILSLTCKVIADRGPRIAFVRPDHLFFAGVCRDLLDTLPHYDDRPGARPFNAPPILQSALVPNAATTSPPPQSNTSPQTPKPPAAQTSAPAPRSS